MSKKICIIWLVFILLLPSRPVNAATPYKLNVTTCTLNGVGKTYSLKLNAPANTVATWKSSNTSIASVSKSGVVTAKMRGTVNITCTVKNGKVTKKLSCKVTVKVPAKAIEFTNAVIVSEYNSQTVNNAHVIELGSSYDFNSKLISSSSKSTSSDVVRYYIQDTTIATVNSKTGLVTPLKAGYTTLTVCSGATVSKATSIENTIKQVINLYIVNPAQPSNLTYLGYTLDDTGLVVSLNFNEPVSIKKLLPSSVKRLDNKYLTDKSSLLTLSNYSLTNDNKTIRLDLSSLDPADHNTPIELTLSGITSLIGKEAKPYTLVANIYILNSQTITHQQEPTVIVQTYTPPVDAKPYVEEYTFEKSVDSGYYYDTLILTYNCEVTLLENTGFLTTTVDDVHKNMEYNATVNGNTVTLVCPEGFFRLSTISIPDSLVINSQSFSDHLDCTADWDVAPLPRPSGIQLAGEK